MDSNNKTTIYPYIPNSTPQIKADMLKSIGVENIEQLYQEIPEKLKLKKRLNLPPPFLAEMDLKKHVLII
jgi:glycine dehydrogenase subunit 1